MKIQSLAVIFAIIVLPIVIILSYYIHAEVDTIALQTSYDTKLIDSTHDAIASFEINTANENLSSVADSLRSIIEAACNVFFNTLATNLGISNAGNAAVDGYVPALLYTLYDGYYIYSPTRIPEVLTDEKGRAVCVGDDGVSLAGGVVTIPGGTARKYNYTAGGGPNSLDYSTVDYELGQMLFKNKDGTYSTQLHTNNLDDDTKYNQKHILKSYMPYSARYKRGNDFDFTINYTLDNYITIEGVLHDVYFSKTGYLISKNTVTGATVGPITDILNYNEIAAEEKILSGEYDITITIDPLMERNPVTGVINRVSAVDGSPITITFTPQHDPDGNVMNYTQIKERLAKLYENQDANIGEIQDLEYEAANLSAINYYIKAQIFSNWVYNNLSDLRAGDITDDIAQLNDGIYDTDSQMDIFHKFKEYADDGVTVIAQDNTIIFSDTENPELEDSPFFTHKLDVIRNNIQYNLNLAISAYNKMTQTKTAQLPVISDNEWEQILTRISVVSFMQGLNCGMKTYNNYAIASSTNNELTVIPTEMFYTYKETYNKLTSPTDNVNDFEYHKIDCDDLLTNDGTNDKQYISFKSKEVKYDKIYDKPSTKYIYDHRNLACYRCAISRNYLKDIYERNTGSVVKGYGDDIQISLLPPVKKQAYYIALGKERQNLYKTNAITDSNGYEVFGDLTGTDISFTSSGSSVMIATGTSKRSVSDLREVEITLSNLHCINENEATVNFKLVVNNTVVDYKAALNLDQITPQTLVIPVHLEDSNPVSYIYLQMVDSADAVTCKKMNVRLVYE